MPTGWTDSSEPLLDLNDGLLTAAEAGGRGFDGILFPEESFFEFWC